MKPTSGIAAMAFAVLAFASTAALAENGTGFYLGGGAGYAGQRIDCDGASNCSNSHSGFKVLAGYQIMPNFAIETGYGNTGRSKGSGYGADGSVKTNSFTIAALGLYPVSKEIELFGKLGMHATKTKYNVDFAGHNAVRNVTDSFNGNGLLVGVGAQYRFTPNLIGRVEYEYLNRGVRIADLRADINLVTASVLYQF